MKVAILVYSDGIVTTSTEYSLGLTFMREVYTHAPVCCLHIDESDVVILCHRMSYTAYLYFDVAIIYTGHHGKVLLYTGIYGIHGELLHFFTTTYYRNLRVNNFLDNVPTMFTFEKFYCHNHYHLKGL